MHCTANPLKVIALKAWLAKGNYFLILIFDLVEAFVVLIFALCLLASFDKVL